jgi:uncharacterized protein
MKLFVEQLTETPKDFSSEAPPRWWRERVAGARDAQLEAREPFVFRLSAHRMGADVFLEGTVEGAFDAECSRCLTRYRHPLREEFRLLLEPAGERVPADPEAARALHREGMCLGDELEAGWYGGPEIRLDGFFAEVIALAMPYQPLCREECPGLCPHCGAERAAGCACEATRAPVSDSPFAVLAALRRAGDEGEG